MDSPLTLPINTDDVIEAIIHALSAHGLSPQAEHIYRESLRNLVRLAKAEQANELQTCSTYAVTALPGQAVH